MSSKIIGFTGSRHGLTVEQRERLREGITRLAAAGYTALAHGDCVGADVNAHTIARELGLEIHIYPPDRDEWCAFCDGATVIHLARPYMERNRAIVDACRVLVACPDGEERTRSGTWATVRMARRLGRTVIIVMPSGEVRR